MNSKRPYYRRGQSDYNKDQHRINKRIRVPKVRVIDVNGDQLGILETDDALKRAQDQGLDLVEVAPTARPPVCKIMDYGKHKYKEQKKLAESKKNRNDVVIKEIRIRYRTSDGDLNTKMEKARAFLDKGYKVKFSMMFRGREITFIHLGLEKFKDIAASLDEVAVVDAQSPKPGKQIFVTFAPRK